MEDVRLVVRQVFEAADNKIVGRIRLQKIFYLLEQMGLQSGLKFSYYHYGPYCEKLTNEVSRVGIIDKAIIETTKYTIDGNPFSVFEQISKLNQNLHSVGGIDYSDAKVAIRAMKQEQSVVIEIAATIHWLRYKEHIKEWKSELVKRKRSKASDLNVQKALNLLVELELSPL